MSLAVILISLQIQATQTIQNEQPNISTPNLTPITLPSQKIVSFTGLKADIPIGKIEVLRYV